jgi:cell wall-associated NlpC family hydrolase
MEYLGVPYVWGGSTPEGFDCSGLTWHVYRRIGVSVPRNSRSQFTVGAYIPPDRMDLLLPGDLVFFGYESNPERIHHVGIFVGGGDYLHAPSTGRPVQVESLTSRIARRGDYVGATRP